MDIFHMPTCLVSGGLGWGLTHLPASGQYPGCLPVPAHTLPATVLRFTEGEKRAQWRGGLPGYWPTDTSEVGTEDTWRPLCKISGP